MANPSGVGKTEPTPPLEAVGLALLLRDGGRHVQGFLDVEQLESLLLAAGRRDHILRVGGGRGHGGQ